MNWIYTEFGQRLRNARKAVQLTQDALAERVGLSRTSITNIEQGRQHISLHKAYLLASAVGIRTSQLLPDEKSEAPNSDVLSADILRRLPGLAKEGQDWVKRIMTSGTNLGK